MQFDFLNIELDRCLGIPCIVRLSDLMKPAEGNVPLQLYLGAGQPFSSKSKVRCIAMLYTYVTDWSHQKRCWRCSVI